MPSQELSKHLGLCFAQLGKLARSVHHRAVVLAQLGAVAGQWLHRRRKALLTEPIGDFLNCGRRRSISRRGRDAKQAPSTLVGEILDSFPAVSLGEEPEGLEREGVIGLLTGCSSGPGEGENLTWSTPPRARLGSIGHLVRCLNQTGVLEGFERPTYRRGRRSQLLGQCGGRARPPLGEAPRNALCGVGREFHNTIVS